LVFIQNTLKVNMAKKNTEKEMSFLDHLEELRWHIIRSLLGALVFMILAFINRNFIFSTIILGPKNPGFFTNRIFAQASDWINSTFGLHIKSMAINTKPLEIVNIDMAGQFTSHINVSLVAGLIAASPYIFWELWQFIKPALFPAERKYARGAVFYTSFLFLLGVLFGYYLIAPLSIHFLGSYIVSDEVTNTIKLNSYISTITSVCFASGVVFELPILILFLSKVGLMTPAFMKKYRRHAYVLLLLIAAIITPPDVFSQILVCLPLVILYEVSVFISRSAGKKREKAQNS
jgi:sec-independent protein translocase protein TatC